MSLSLELLMLIPSSLVSVYVQGSPLMVHVLLVVIVNVKGDSGVGGFILLANILNVYGVDEKLTDPVQVCAVPVVFNSSRQCCNNFPTCIFALFRGTVPRDTGCVTSHALPRHSQPRPPLIYIRTEIPQQWRGRTVWHIL